MKLPSITRTALGLVVAAVCGVSVAEAAAAYAQVRRIDIDILPNRKENEIKLSDKKKSIQVVVLGETNFSVARIEPGTVEFAGALPVAQTGRRLDSNFDQRTDVEYRFEIGKMVLTDTTTSLCLTGKLQDGEHFRGCGEVVIKP